MRKQRQLSTHPDTDKSLARLCNADRQDNSLVHSHIRHHLLFVGEKVIIYFTKHNKSQISVKKGKLRYTWLTASQQHPPAIYSNVTRAQNSLSIKTFKATLKEKLVSNY